MGIVRQLRTLALRGVTVCHRRCGSSRREARFRVTVWSYPLERDWKQNSAGGRTNMDTVSGGREYAGSQVAEKIWQPKRSPIGTHHVLAPASGLAAEVHRMAGSLTTIESLSFQVVASGAIFLSPIRVQLDVPTFLRHSAGKLGALSTPKRPIHGTTQARTHLPCTGWNPLYFGSTARRAEIC